MKQDFLFFGLFGSFFLFFAIKFSVFYLRMRRAVFKDLVNQICSSSLPEKYTAFFVWKERRVELLFEDFTKLSNQEIESFSQKAWMYTLVVEEDPFMEALITGLIEEGVSRCQKEAFFWFENGDRGFALASIRDGLKLLSRHPEFRFRKDFFIEEFNVFNLRYDEL